MTKKNKTNRLIGYLSGMTMFVAPSISSAKTLMEYRSQAKAPNQGAQTQVAQILERLKVPAFAATPRTTALRQANSTNRHKVPTSMVLKNFMSQGIDELEEIEKYHQPLLFDPSSQHYEARRAKIGRRVEMCRTFLAKPYHKNDRRPVFEVLLSEFSLAIGRKQRLTPQPFAEEDRLVEDLRERIPAKATKILGQLAKVQYVDGTVTHLKFSGGATLSLGSLISFRTGRDERFLALQSCFYSTLKRAIEEEKPRKELKLMKAFEPIMKQRIVTAARSYAQLRKLDKATINQLLGFTLALRGDDVPVLNELVRQGEKLPVLLQQFFPNGKKPSRAQVNDYSFYYVLAQELAELNEFLVEDQALTKQTEQIKAEIRESTR